MTLKQEEKLVNDLFGDSSCPNNDTNSVEEINEAIGECQAMLEYSVDTHNQTEVKFWRKLLQENKVMKRGLLTA